MYECDIIEVEDFRFSHYIHHLDELESDDIDYKDGLEFVYNIADDELD